MGRKLSYKDKYPGVSPYYDQHDKKRWRFRKAGITRQLGTEYESDEFLRRYEAALHEVRTGQRLGAGASTTIPGSVSDLIARYYLSPQWSALAEITKKTYRAILEPFRSAHGTKPIRQLKRRHVAEFLAQKAETPAAANNLRKRLCQLLDHAIALDWITVNPARLTKPYKITGEGYHDWTEAEIARFYAVHQPGSVAHRVVTLMLYTGAARGDAVALGPMNVKNGRIEYRRHKTLNSNGVLISIPLHPDLAEVLAGLPNDRTFLTTATGAARSPNGLTSSMRSWCTKAGLPECSSHGLRKACARRLAEAGATTLEIMAVTGHKTLAEVERYTAAAMREGLADRAFEKLLARPTQQLTVVNLASRFAKNSTNTLK